MYLFRVVYLFTNILCLSRVVNSYLQINLFIFKSNQIQFVRFIVPVWGIPYSDGRRRGVWSRGGVLVSWWAGRAWEARRGYADGRPGRGLVV